MAGCKWILREKHRRIRDTVRFRVRVEVVVECDESGLV